MENINKTEKGIFSRFYFDGDMLLAKNIYTYLNLQDDYLEWFENCIKKYDLVENEDYITFIKPRDGFKETDYILMYSNKSYDLLTLEILEAKEKKDAKR